MRNMTLQTSSPESVEYRFWCKFRNQCSGFGALVASSILCLSMSSTAVLAQEEEDGPRPPPETRSANTLSRSVYTRVEDIQEYHEAEQYAEALAELGELREMYNEGDLSPYETFIMWQFYASIAMTQENIPQSIDYWRNALEIANAELGSDQAASIYLTLGQLLYTEERVPEAIDHLLTYLDIAVEPSNSVWNLLATAYYVQEDYDNALTYLQEYMRRERAAGEAIEQNTYSMLVAVYFSLGDYPNVKQALREMIVLFDPADSWTQLAGVEGELENFSNQAYTYYLANLKGNLDTEGNLVTLSYLMFQNDNPWGASQVIQKGMDNGIIEEDVDNLAFLAQAYQISREDEKAVGPLARAARMSGDGELYYRLGRIYMTMREWADAVEPLREALDSGDVEREDQVLELLARAYMNLHQYEEGLEAARRIGDYEEGADKAQNWITLVESERDRWEYLQRRREELADWL